MTEQLAEKILTAACEQCHWCHACADEGELYEHCASCEIERLVMEARENYVRIAVDITRIFCEELHSLPENIAHSMFSRAGCRG